LLIVDYAGAGVMASRGDWNSCWGLFNRRRYAIHVERKEQVSELNVFVVAVNRKGLFGALNGEIGCDW